MLNSASSVLSFIKGGKAFFTITSKRTGVRFTYKVSTPKGKLAEGPWFVSVLTGADNENDYKFFGTLFADGFRYSTRSAKVGQDAPSVVAFVWFLRNLESGTSLAASEFHHAGKCCRCGRKLTVPASIESGVGPECASKM